MTALALTYDRSSSVARLTQLFARGFETGAESAQTFKAVELQTPTAWEGIVQARLRKLLQLPRGWDGYSSQPISPNVAQFATDVLNSVMRNATPAPSIVPVAGGGLQLEWHEQGLDVELLIARPFHAELSIEYADGRPAIEEEVIADFSRLSAALREIC